MLLNLPGSSTLQWVVAVYIVKLCAQRLEELSIASSRLENEIKSLRRAGYPDSMDSGEMSRQSPYQTVTGQQQQQHSHSELPAKVCLFMAGSWHFTTFFLAFFVHCVPKKRSKCKGKGLDTCYGATYMSHTCDQQRFTISEVAADWHERKK